jgi:hypothetical protein
VKILSPIKSFHGSSKNKRPEKLSKSIKLNSLRIEYLKPDRRVIRENINKIGLFHYEITLFY